MNEFPSLLSLRLHQSHDGQLTVLQLLGMTRGVADGMAYLSGMNFIHRVSILSLYQSSD